ncbi:MAG: hypothetical protein KAK04_15065 [Cyclobacteriaceae bacterium]|nr:hypothetical protein [Cyclobacteriaceae bacterium]
MNKDGAIPVIGSNDDPSGQAIMDFADSIRNNTEPISNIKTGAKAAISVRIALDAMLKKKTIEWDENYKIS